jgi:hypothetical protein
MRRVWQHEPPVWEAATFGDQGLSPSMVAVTQITMEGD